MSAAQGLRQSLIQGKLSQRYNTIEAAHSSTLEWISHQDSILRKWFDDDTKLFWINGKPGSGKSTIMKHIYAHKHKFNSKNDRADIYAHFFFSHRGSNLQKSLEGLLYCLLYQILNQSDDLADIVLRFVEPVSQEETRRWTIDELEGTFFHLLQQHHDRFRFWLFLDALDEFEGDPEKVVRFIERCVVETESSRVALKLCFASRPWNVFNTHFTTTARLQVEDHTAADIRKYVVSRTNSHPTTSLMLQSSDKEEQTALISLQEEVITQAKGVFLWVRLVLDDLLSSLMEGSSTEELRVVLAQLPDGLEELYVALVERIKSGFLREGYIMLEIVLRNQGILPVQKFWDAERSAFCRPGAIGNYKCRRKGSPSIHPNRVRARIRSRCGGLIELIGSGQELAVQLMHQTTKEFLLRPDTMRLFLPPEDPLSLMDGPPSSLSIILLY